jgi:alginate O-acetyltransferase complex protein AlgI
MLFCSSQFLVFFIAVFAVYWAMPWRQPRVWLLMGASLFFYASWNKYLALLVAVSTTIDYALARGMEATTVSWRRKWMLGASLTGNLGLLCYFKYANFFLGSLEEVLHAAGATTSLPVLRVLLPVGISFYTFEAISYTVDVYRRRMPAERDLANFMVFILFFPHLVAGPIVRARDFLPQVRRPKHWSWLRLQWGAQLFLVGLFKKLVIADRMAMFADPIFASPGHCLMPAAWLAVLAYSVQIYCDFSGYTDMALGVAHLLGYKLAVNFKAPYLAANVQDFWRRWHISLSSWLRDYMFIPLGGSRAGEWQLCRNLLVTMTLGGLWHGASWTFVAWGLLHGMLLVGHRGMQRIGKWSPAFDRALLSSAGTGLRVATTFLTVSLLWVFFRAADFRTALRLFSRLVALDGNWPAPGLTNRFAELVAAMILLHLFAQWGWWRKWAVDLPAPVRGLGYAVVLALALMLAPDSGKAFIYFQF